MRDKKVFRGNYLGWPLVQTWAGGRDPILYENNFLYFYQQLHPLHANLMQPVMVPQIVVIQLVVIVYAHVELLYQLVKVKTRCPSGFCPTKFPLLSSITSGSFKHQAVMNFWLQTLTKYAHLSSWLIQKQWRRYLTTKGSSKTNYSNIILVVKVNLWSCIKQLDK